MTCQARRQAVAQQPVSLHRDASPKCLRNGKVRAPLRSRQTSRSENGIECRPKASDGGSAFLRRVRARIIALLGDEADCLARRGAEVTASWEFRQSVNCAPVSFFRATPVRARKLAAAELLLRQQGRRESVRAKVRHPWRLFYGRWCGMRRQPDAPHPGNGLGGIAPECDCGKVGAAGDLPLIASGPRADTH